MTSLVWGAGVFAGSILAQTVSIALWSHQGGTHMVWFPGAVLLAALLSAPTAAWIACIVGMLAGVVAVAAGFGLKASDTALVIAPVLLLSPLAAYVLLLVPGDISPLEDFGKLFAFGAVAVVGLPLACSLCIYFLAGYTSLRGSVLSDWRNIALAHALGYALYVPAWAGLICPDSALRRSGGPSGLLVTSMAFAIIVLWAVWYYLGDQPTLRPLLILAPAPIVIWGAVAAQMPGTSCSVLAIAMLAAHLSMIGRGPFMAGNAADTTLSVQLWTLAASLCAAVLATLIEQRVAARRALAETNREVRELAGRLIVSQEYVRAKLARDLHDDINQRLAAASIQLSGLRRKVCGETRDTVAGIQSQLVSLSEDVRQLSHELHPSMLRQTGLSAALGVLCQARCHLHDPAVSLSVDERTDDLPDDVALCFYRVVQEALSNAIRYAKAKHVNVDVIAGLSLSSLSIVDDGVGFVHKGIGHDGSHGLGLVSMEERAKLLGGNFEIRTSPGRGVALCIRIPLSK